MFSVWGLRVGFFFLVHYSITTFFYPSNHTLFKISYFYHSFLFFYIQKDLRIRSALGVPRSKESESFPFIFFPNICGLQWNLDVVLQLQSRKLFMFLHTKPLIRDEGIHQHISFFQHLFLSHLLCLRLCADSSRFNRFFKSFILTAFWLG